MMGIYLSNLKLSTKLISAMLLLSFAHLSYGAIDIDSEIEMYKNALLDNDNYGTFEVFRFNTTSVFTTASCVECKQTKIVGIPDYSVFANNLFITSFHIQAINGNDVISDTNVANWIDNTFTNINASKVINKSPSVKQVFISSDRFIESHFRISNTKNDFLNDHREFISQFQSVAPKLADIALLVRESLVNTCLKSQEIKDIASQNLMYVFLAALHMQVNEEDIQLIEKIHSTVRDNVDCENQEQWVENVSSQLSVNTGE